ncbi:Putative carboxylesterase, type B, carboxylesterase type B, active, alpha/Beta hydrolase [Septoria linicola]|uniref:Carboxylic ester hydrolase n=1 Tax=Septoria linicola TaxID=215465 RepID=A0A9Q9EQ40_9PEZI|nr:putative carboxylesterase, type B, carboxylesterase type B, active, alpha/Beta hydrolase [Septoria linicola]USW59431.1 Putative carboxylesterase, type B, carboxylesterase type B, active, alpha/Beta hydrolase [Septoria linicola]
MRSQIFLPGFFATSAFATDPIVKVLNGSYSGIHLPQYAQDLFLGIPYAQDTGGENRFRIPQTLDETWDDVRPASSYSNACPSLSQDDQIYGMSENCLSINIVRPSGLDAGEKLPVLLWIHGGSYQVGTTGRPDYNLTFIVERSVELGKPIIGASINYRKGGWGNMYSIEVQGSGNTNLAVRDMRKGLSWINENIEAFGGDNCSVTIWGESSGSFAVGQLLLSYGGRTDGLSTAQSRSQAQQLRLGTMAATDTLACLRTLEYDEICPLLNYSNIAGPGWYPTVDGDIVPNYPTILLEEGRFAHVPHLYGSTSDEGTDNVMPGIDNDEELRIHLLYNTGFQFPNSTVDKLLELYPDDPTVGVPINTGNERFLEYGIQYKRAAAIIGDVFYHAPRLADARQYAKRSPTYIYRFNTRPWLNSTGELAPAHKGVQHFSEVAFVFNNPTFVGPYPEYRALSDQMSAQWINFAHSGDPNGQGLPEWPKYDDSPAGQNLVLQTMSQGGSYVEEDTYRLQGREYLTKWARRRHV